MYNPTDSLMNNDETVRRIIRIYYTGNILYVVLLKNSLTYDDRSLNQHRYTCREC